MIIDPHSSLWEADLVCVVHDISDDFLKGNSFLLLSSTTLTSSKRFSETILFGGYI